MSTFTIKDIAALQEIPSAFSKIDLVLNDLKPYFEEKIKEKIKTKETNRLLLNRKAYIDACAFGSRFSINYGVGWFIKGEVFIYLDFHFLNIHKRSELAENIQSKLDGATYLYNNEEISVGYKKPLADFLNKPNQIDLIKAYLKECIDKVEDLKDNYNMNPIIFK